MRYDQSYRLLSVFADADEEGVCVDGIDRAGSLVPTRFDALAMVVHFEFQPDNLTGRCADWGL